MGLQVMNLKTEFLPMNILQPFCLGKNMFKNICLLLYKEVYRIISVDEYQTSILGFFFPPKSLKLEIMKIRNWVRGVLYDK